MPWLELKLRVAIEHQPEAEAVLEELGALAVTLLDADVDTDEEEAILEPGVGETPLWRHLLLQALFEADRDRRHLAEALSRNLAWLEPDALDFRDVADENWERAWMDRFQPMRFGNRLWVYPWNAAPPADTGQVIVRLDPGLAFGTGTHPTTAMCLAWLDGAELAGRTVIDYGCGSGVLAIAALKLGATHVIGIDNDPQALTASRDNAERNGVGTALDLYLPDDVPTEPADIVLANILAGPLGELAPHLASLCRPDGHIVLSGILDGQHEPLLDRYATWFGTLDTRIEDGWVRIRGRRQSDPGKA